jgi:RAT1-interacting protein
MESRRNENQPQRNRRGPPLEVMQFWGAFSPTAKTESVGTDLEPGTPGYKFETLSTLPSPWGECSRDFIENRENEVVNNKEQYCSVVRTGLGKTTMCLGGEVDASKSSCPELSIYFFLIVRSSRV